MYSTELKKEIDALEKNISNEKTSIGVATVVLIFSFFLSSNLGFFLSFFYVLLWAGFIFRLKKNTPRIERLREHYANEIADEEIEKKCEQQGKYFIFFEDLAEIARIISKHPPTTIPDEPPEVLPLKQKIQSYWEALLSLGLDPNKSDWRNDPGKFLEYTQHLSPNQISTVRNNIFGVFAYHFDNREFIKRLERETNHLLATFAPRQGFHVYGLPAIDACPEHESRDLDNYLIKPTDRFKHAYILGKTGAGKTTLMKNLITQDIMRGDGVILLSPESGLFHFLLEDFPTSRIRDLIIFDPTDDTAPYISLNPIHLEDRRDLAREAGAVSGTLARAIGDDLSGAMQTLLLKCAYTLLQLPNSSFQDLRALLKPKSPLRDSLPSSPHIDEITREYWRDEFDKGGHRRSAEALISRLDAFFMPPLARTMSRASFALSRALNASHSVFLFDYSRIHGTQQSVIGQLTISHILQTLLNRDSQSEDDRIPYHFYIDEFQTFAEQNESAFRDLLNRARKYKMSVTLAHQVSSDIPPRLLDTILGNVGTKVCLQLATTDAEFFAKQIHVKEIPEPRNVGYEKPHHPPPAEFLERLQKGEGFLSTPNLYEALKITIPAKPLFYGDGVPRPNSYPDMLRRASKKRYGTTGDTPPDPRPAPPSSSPPNDEDDDGIFT